MKILACSDMHGDLPVIKSSADILLICGDFSPLELQRHIDYMNQWLDEIFLPWLSGIQVSKVVFIAGNHDFVCMQSNFKSKLQAMLEKQHLEEKVHYICNELLELTIGNKVISLYGTPYVQNCYGWAFSLPVADSVYAGIPKCDILLTHQPPAISSFGSTYFRKRGKVHRALGSDALARVLSTKDPLCRLAVFGHIHTGRHIPMVLPNGCTINNVSLKDEGYALCYPVWSYEFLL